MNVHSVIKNFVSDAQLRGDDVFVRLEEGGNYHLAQVETVGDGAVRLLYGKRRGVRSYSAEVWPDTRVIRAKNQLRMRDMDGERLEILAIPGVPREQIKNT